MHYVFAAVLVLLSPGFVVAQSAATPVAQAFEHYEAIRARLAADQLDTVATHAGALAPLAGQVAGTAAQAAAERIATAKTIEAVRDQFMVVSAALTPKFLDAGLPGVHAFMCPMKKAPWAQRSTAMENPYYGKAMLACGTEIKASP